MNQNIYIDDPINFQAIFRSDVSSIILRRDLEDNFAQYCQVLTDNFDIDIKNKGLESNHLFAQEFNSRCKKILFKDIGYLTNLFNKLFNKCDFKFNVSGTDDCSRFHVDNVKFRMFVTYAGPTTELLDPRLVRRQFLNCNEEADRANTLIRGISPTIPLLIGDVLLLKGSKIKGQENSGAVHKPPLLEAQKKRKMTAVFTCR